jgi:hypothetical protein
MVVWRAAHQTFDYTDPARLKTLLDADVATSYTIPGLTNGTEYYVKVLARNERENTWTGTSIEARQTPMAAGEDMLAAPNPIEAMAGDMEVMVNWTAVQGADKYRVQWRTAAQSYDDQRQHDGFYNYRSGDLELSYTVPGLENGTEYMFRVVALDASGNMGAYSDEVSAMPMMPTPALPVFGAIALAGALAAAGRRRMRQRQLRSAKLRYLPKR